MLFVVWACRSGETPAAVFFASLKHSKGLFARSARTANGPRHRLRRISCTAVASGLSATCHVSHPAMPHSDVKSGQMRVIIVRRACEPAQRNPLRREDRRLESGPECRVCGKKHGDTGTLDFAAGAVIGQTRDWAATCRRLYGKRARSLSCVRSISDAFRKFFHLATCKFARPAARGFAGRRR